MKKAAPNPDYHIYTDEEKQFCVAHYNVDMTPSEIAAKFGVASSSLRARVSVWRLANIAAGLEPGFVKGRGTGRKQAAVGTIAIRQWGNRLIYRIKTETGWKFLRSERDPDAPKSGRPANYNAETKPRKPRTPKARTQLPSRIITPKPVINLNVTVKTRPAATDPSRPRKINHDENPAIVRIPTSTGLMSIHIDSKTTILVHPSKVQEVKQKYGLQ